MKHYETIEQLCNAPESEHYRPGTISLRRQKSVVRLPTAAAENWFLA
jgi:hypothetical protein